MTTRRGVNRNISGSSSTATATCTSRSSAPTWWRKPTRSSPTTTERCFQTAEGPPPDFLSSAPCYQERRQATYLADPQHLTPKKPLLSAPVLRERVRPLAAMDRRSGIGKAGPRGLPGGHLVLGPRRFSCNSPILTHRDGRAPTREVIPICFRSGSSISLCFSNSLILWWARLGLNQ
jgi:hypothetical protein